MVIAALLIPGVALAADAAPHAPSEAVFVAQVILLLVCGRLMGEAMQRLGQPAVMGQLIAGVLLGPSVFGALWPSLHHAVFPGVHEQKAMIDAVGQLGILMLLLLTGMETDLSVVRKARRAAISVSLAGIAVPFACGIVLGELLPASMLPNPDQRLITTLFLGIALAISSVKIVALVVRDLNFLRRLVGQTIVAAAIVDDTIGWIILSVILGLASHGQINLGAVAGSVLGTALFLAASFTVGRRVVSLLIRWSNDNFVSDLPVITTIIVIMGVMALITNWIGVHTVLGAFVAGILVGQSPILTRHIDEQLRGLIVALFMPVFFGLAGFNANIAVLADPSTFLLSLTFIAIASLGKFSGAFLGGGLGGMSWRESLTLGCGMNARGSTEVVVASIGLAMGALNQTLFTIILAMAVVTTMAMPPMLRWAFARLPLRPDEEARLEREAFEAQGFVTRMERLLLAVDDSATGRFASRIGGLLAGTRRLPTTIVAVAREPQLASSREPPKEKAEAVVKATAAAAERQPDEDEDAAPVDVTARTEDRPAEEAVTREARKGYDLLVVGAEPVADGEVFDDKVGRIATSFSGPVAIASARGAHVYEDAKGALDILVPVTGTEFSHRAAELAITLARADNGSVTALYVAHPRRRSWGRQLRRPWRVGAAEESILRDVVELGDRLGVTVRTAVRTNAAVESAILRQAAAGGHNLIVLGVSPRAGKTLFYGHVAAALLDRAEHSLLFVASRPGSGRS